MFRKILLVMGVVLALGFVWPVLNASCEEQSSKVPWWGRLGDGTVINEAGLNVILQEHKKWLVKKYTHGLESNREAGRRANLSGANLRNANLRNANLGEADLTNADLTSADLQEASLYMADLSDADLTGANLRDVDLSNMDLRNVSLRSADLRNANLISADLRGANLRKAKLRGAFLSEADLRSVNLRKMDLRKANLSEADLRDADLREADLTEANLFKAKLDGANFRGAQLVNSNLLRATLRRAHFGGVDLFDACTEGASTANAALAALGLTLEGLARAEFIGHELIELGIISPDFLGANLSGADLRLTDLRDADLRKVDLSGADLTGVDISGANLRGAKLMKAKMKRVLTKGVLYEPIPDSAPNIHLLSAADGLWKLCFFADSSGLSQLKNEFKKSGYTAKTSEIRHAIKHNKGGINWHSYVAYWLLEWPTGWGESSLFPLALLALSMIPFTYLYVISFGWSETGGIILGRLNCQENWKPKKAWVMFLYALYCSFQMGLRVFWKDPSKGTWMTHMQPTDLVFVPKGGWRTVVGLQNIIGSYFIALFLLTYFGGLFKD